MKKHNKICILALVISLFLFVQYLYSHWPELEVVKSIYFEKAYSGLISYYGYNYVFCDRTQIIEKEEDILRHTYTVNLETGEYSGPTTKFYKEIVKYIPCYIETKTRHWENLWK